MIESLELKFSRRWQTNKIESDWSNSPRHSSSRQFRSPRISDQAGMCNIWQRMEYLIQSVPEAAKRKLCDLFQQHPGSDMGNLIKGRLCKLFIKRLLFVVPARYSNLAKA